VELETLTLPPATRAFPWCLIPADLGYQGFVGQRIVSQRIAGQGVVSKGIVGTEIELKG
jgi:hypothetical protein